MQASQRTPSMRDGTHLAPVAGGTFFTKDHGIEYQVSNDVQVWFDMGDGIIGWRHVGKAAMMERESWLKH